MGLGEALALVDAAEAKSADFINFPELAQLLESDTSVA